MVGCGWLCKWEIFPNMGWFMCTVYVTWATSKVLANCERLHKPSADFASPVALLGVDVCRRWPADSVTFAA